MTKEELEKEAEDYALKQWEGNIPWGVIKKAYYDSAEPREKQITGLSKHILELQKDKGNLIDRCRELEAQIEKMKCCSNCMWSDCDGKLGNPPCKYCDFNNKWELRR